jgi:hypothetical protein
MGGLGLLLSLFLVGIGQLIGVIPVESLNIPHHVYWLAPDRRG